MLSYQLSYESDPLAPPDGDDDGSTEPTGDGRDSDVGGAPRAREADQPDSGGKQGGRRPGGSPPSRSGSGGSGGSGGGDGSSLGPRVGVVLLGILLTASIVGAHGVVASQRTALSASYVSETMAEEGAFEELEVTAEDIVVDQAAGALGTSGAIPDSGGLIERAVRELVTRDYVERVVTTNLERLYDFLHGREPLELGIDTTPIKSDVAGAVTAELREVPVPDLLQQPSFEGGFGEFGLDAATVAEAYEDQATYREVQQDVRSQFEQSGADRDRLNQSVIDSTDVSGLPEDVQQSVYRLETTVVLAFTSDMSHDEFRQRMDAARDDFAVAVGDFAQAQIDEQVPDEIDADEELDADARQQLGTAADNVQLVDTIGLVLPILALIFLLLIGWLTHSIGRTARILGSSLLVTGVVGVLAGAVARGPALDIVREAVVDAEPFVQSTAVALIGGVFETITRQSLLLAVVGLIFVAVWLAIGRTEPDAIPRRWH